jgi:hypothetical protein
MAKKPSLEQLLMNLANKHDAHYDDLDKRLDNIEKVMLAQEINLQTHMKRSDNLEALVGSIREKELEPLNKHVAAVEGIVKFIGVVSLFVGIATGIASLFGMI